MYTTIIKQIIITRKKSTHSLWLIPSLVRFGSDIEGFITDTSINFLKKFIGIWFIFNGLDRRQDNQGS
ncbi:MAG TPA: hypothetical protein VNS32_05010, partial [Flavisolibacter sp.]|nr:hypothetical protein [Flavisolibacter sp.]